MIRSLRTPRLRAVRTAVTGIAAFTLVEMLVSVAVLVLIMVFIAQMMSSVSLTTSLSAKRIDTDNQARMVFDRMALDFAGMPHRNDIEYLFSKQDGTVGSNADLNDKMFFYSQAPAFFDTSQAILFPATGTDPKSDMSLVGYVINTGSSNNGQIIPPPPYCIQRLSKGLVWDQNFSTANQDPGGISFLTFNPNIGGLNKMTPLAGSTIEGNAHTSTVVGSYPAFSGTDADYSMLGNQVFRMEFCYQVKDLTPGGNGGTVFSDYPVAVFTDSANTTGSGNATNEGPSVLDDPPTQAGSTGAGGQKIHQGDRWYNPKDNMAMICTGVSSAGDTWAPNGLADVTAIVVTIAVMDTNSRKTLNQTQLASAASYLPDFSDAVKNGRSNYPAESQQQLMASSWEEALAATAPNTFAASAQIPQFAASQIRVYQRFFYLNNY